MFLPAEIPPTKNILNFASNVINPFLHGINILLHYILVTIAIKKTVVIVICEASKVPNWPINTFLEKEVSTNWGIKNVNERRWSIPLQTIHKLVLIAGQHKNKER